jgi:hypothetical protein
VAAHTVLQVGNAVFAVLTPDVGRFVFMAIVATEGGQRVKVTGPAWAWATIAMVEGEGVGAIIACRGPGIGGVARSTVGSQSSHVEAWLAVASRAGLWTILKVAARVTLSAR